MNVNPFSCSRALALGLLGIALAGVAGCATHPKPPPPAPTAATPPASTPYTPAPPRTHTPPPPAPVSTAPLPGTLRDFTVNVGERVYFDYDQYTLRPDAVPVLTAQARWLQRYPQVQVRLEGNADERGTEEYNLALGARRANSVKTFLIEQGVATNRIATISYGKERPIDPGPSDEERAHNRNVHTAITAGAQ